MSKSHHCRSQQAAIVDQKAFSTRLDSSDYVEIFVGVEGKKTFFD